MQIGEHIKDGLKTGKTSLTERTRKMRRSLLNFNPCISTSTFLCSSCSHLPGINTTSCTPSHPNHTLYPCQQHIILRFNIGMANRLKEIRFLPYCLNHFMELLPKLLKSNMLTKMPPRSVPNPLRRSHNMRCSYHTA